MKTNALPARPAAAVPPSRIQATSEERRLQRFDALYETYAPGVYRFCLRLTAGRTADAEDLTQEVLLAAYQGLPRFAGRSAIRTWLYRIAVFRWRTLRDTQARGNGGGETTALDTTAPDSRAPDMASATVARLSLETALAALPDPLREAFLLVKAEGLTHREAARVLDAPQGTVQSRVHEAVKRLRVLLADDFPTYSTTMETDSRPEASGDKITERETDHDPANE